MNRPAPLFHRRLPVRPGGVANLTATTFRFREPMKDELATWMHQHRPELDDLTPSAHLWVAIAKALLAVPAAETSLADPLHAFAGLHREAFDTLTPSPALWEAIAAELESVPARQSAPMVAVRGGRLAPRPVWWQAAAAAAVVFGLGYGLRMKTETGSGAATPQAAPIAWLTGSAPAEAPQPDAVGDQRSAFASVPRSYHDEPDPAVRAALLTTSEDAAEREMDTAPNPEADAGRAAAGTPSAARQALALAPEVGRLEARYDALVAQNRTRSRTTRPARPLADEWDREMAVLDSTYTELRRELTRNANTERVVAAMTRNLHLRMELLAQQTRALEGAQQARQRAIAPRRPPSVNPDAGDEAGNWPDARMPVSPAPALDGRAPDRDRSPDRETLRPGGHGPLAERPTRYPLALI